MFEYIILSPEFRDINREQLLQVLSLEHAPGLDDSALQMLRTVLSTDPVTDEQLRQRLVRPASCIYVWSVMQ